MRKIWRDNGLSIVLLAMFLVSLGGQSVAGQRRHNEEQREHGRPPVGYVEYLRTPEFLSATAENWESEFLQMATYVLLTVFLFQRGSSESKDPDRKDPVDRAPNPKRKDAPGPVRRGGLALALYRQSLSVAFLSLFVVSLVLHAVGGSGQYNEEQAEHGGAERVTPLAYMGTSRFWFESLQNWQSEFLAIASMVLLTIGLRQQGSPESKPVDAAHGETGG